LSGPPFTVVHVAQVEINGASGMGRVALHWRRAVERAGGRFIHIGPGAVGPVHPARFAWRAYREFRALQQSEAICLVHEPAALPFVLLHRRTVVFSHGLERRAWEQLAAHGELPTRIRSRLLFPLWRLLPADLGLRCARRVLVLNSEDHRRLLARYGQRPERVLIFENGIDPVAAGVSAGAPETIVFAGSWIPRKGTRTLVGAMSLLSARGLRPRIILAGTGKSEAEVLSSWPPDCRDRVEVVPRYDPQDEQAVLASGAIFVLPSLYEGQPLSLLQAMAMGRACVASDIAGSNELVVDRVTGLLFPAGDEPALARCLELCLTDSELRQRLGADAASAVRDRSWPKVADEVVRFVRAA
jgi:glycosyltransferase involved in cell wall biosynthesis